MNLKLKPISQISLALAAVFVAGAASAALQTVYLSGASAPTQTVFRAFAAGNCTDTDANGRPNVTVFTSGSTSGIPGSIGNAMAYRCIFKGTAPVFANDTVTMHHVVTGGSFSAFAPHLPPSHPAYPGQSMNSEIPLPLVASLTCSGALITVLDPQVPAQLDIQERTGCTIDNVMGPFNGGFSDVEANMWSETLVPDVAGLGLDSSPAGVQQAFGIAVTDELYKAMQTAQGLVVGLPVNPADLTPTEVANQPNMPKADYAGIVAASGGYHKDWEFLLGAPGVGKNVNLCRRVTTSGTQATSNYHFLATPCSKNPINGGLREPAYAGDSNQPIFNVVENSSTGNVKTCLTTRNNTVGQAFGIGYMSMENVPKSTDRWKFVKVNGVSPNEDVRQRRQAARGNYDLVSEMVLFVKPGSSVTIQNFFAKSLAANMAANLDLAGLFATPRTAGATTGPVPDGDKVGRSTREGNSCATFYRGE